ncbi:LON peptidase substrate-binding domain-containing protein [Pseudoalteromonas luteoviolacea]|nr:LON peptidase substrate-binding domain-containing protein [Pseudoalteromonas luteoviolacea]
MKLALFPLPIFLLPQGYTRLRIFEPRYLHMVKVAMKEGSGFVLCHSDDASQCGVSKHGVYVEVVDFSQDKGGQLLIDVHATQRVTITNVSKDEMDLRHGDCEIITDPLWIIGEDDELSFHEKLADLLRDLFVINPQLNTLYKEKNYANPIWVAARWLELLPLTLEQKLKIQSCTSYLGVTNVLAEIFAEQE